MGQISARKGAGQTRRQVFSKLSKEITIAAKMAKPDPDQETRVCALPVKEAKASSTAQGTTSNRAIKKKPWAARARITKNRLLKATAPWCRSDRRGDDDNANRTASDVKRPRSPRTGGNLGEDRQRRLYVSTARERSPIPPAVKAMPIRS